MVARPSTEEPAVRCPRCGYDQRGVMTTWSDFCPLEGVCAECGLTWRWAELLNPSLQRPKWCVEYGSIWSVPWRSLKTLALTFWPGGFWRSLKMHHDVRWRRIVAHLMCSVFILYLLFAITQGVMAGKIWLSFQFGASVASPNGTLLHTTDVSLPLAVAQAIVLPFSGRSLGTVDGSPALLYPPPISLLGHQSEWHEGYLPTLSGTWVRRSDIWRFSSLPPSSGLGNPALSAVAQGVAFSGFSLLVSGLAAACFVLLPQSMRQAKVRWIHVNRIMLYGFAILLLPPYLSVLDYQLRVLFDSGLGMFGGSIFGSCFVGVPIVMFIWWSVACQHYLRLPHAWGVGLAIVTIATLIAAFLYFPLIVSETT